MNDYANENEQWEAIKDWWRQNGKQLIIIFIASLAVGFGWRYWQSHQLEKKQQASQLFDQLLSVQTSDPSSNLISRIATELQQDYTRTPYASLSALFEAKNALAKNDLNTAEQKLIWAMNHAKTSSIQEIAKIRLARVLLTDKKPEQALALLEKDSDKDFLPALEQVKGDIYLSQGDNVKARTAYENALSSLPASTPLKKYVEMQLNQLPTT